MKWTSKPIDAGFYGKLSYPEVMAFVTGPICLLKNIINVVQLWKASKILVGVDLAERAAARLASRQAEEEKQKS